MKRHIALLLSAVLIFPACVNANIAQKMEPKTVLLHMKIKRQKDGAEAWGTCSGVYIKNNIILSAAHCVDMPEGISLVQLWIAQNNGMAEKAVVIKVDPSHDLSLLYTPLEGSPVKLARSVEKGEKCYVIGNPLGMEDTITEGIVSKTNLVIKGLSATFIIIDAIVLPGNSGGAVVNSHGKLIGIVSMTTSILGTFGASGLGIAVSIDDIREFVG